MDAVEKRFPTWRLAGGSVALPGSVPAFLQIGIRAHLAWLPPTGVHSSEKAGLSFVLLRTGDSVCPVLGPERGDMATSGATVQGSRWLMSPCSVEL